MQYLDEFDMNEILYWLLANHDVDFTDRYFAEKITAIAWEELKKAEASEWYERCHEMKQFIEWVPTRF